MAASPHPSRDEVRRALVAALAEVEGVSVEEIENAIAARGGDNLYELDSKTAECLIGPLVALYGRRLPGPADLEPEQYATIESLTDLVQGELQSAPA
ncbi:hypothetical protein HF845_10600 [Cellulosimicrobium aquatile]|nr:hypothetical protein [Cellulosimicrobium aquatile]